MPRVVLLGRIWHRFLWLIISGGAVIEVTQQASKGLTGVHRLHTNWLWAQVRGDFQWHQKHSSPFSKPCEPPLSDSANSRCYLCAFVRSPLKIQILITTAAVLMSSKYVNKTNPVKPLWVWFILQTNLQTEWIFTNCFLSGKLYITHITCSLLQHVTVSRDDPPSACGHWNLQEFTGRESAWDFMALLTDLAWQKPHALQVSKSRGIYTVLLGS